jgi:hypothetical protein
MAVYSQPSGSPSDFIPGFAKSRWSYSLSNVNRVKLRKAETIILYTGTTRPQVHLNIPAYPLDLASVNGDGLSSEIVAYMTVNTQATTSKIGYLLQYTGFLNSAIGFNREFQFKNSKERVIQNNQYSGSVTVNVISGFNLETTQSAIKTQLEKNTYDANGNLNIVGNVGITGTPTVTIDNASINTHCYASSSGNSWHRLKSDNNGILNIHSRTEDGAGNDITSTEIGSVRALDVNLAGGSITVDSVKIKDSDGYSLSAVSNLVPQLKTTLYNTSATEIGTSSNPIFSSITNSPTIKIDTTDNSIKLTNGSYTADVLPTIANLSTSEGLVTDSALFAFNTNTGDIQPLTVNLNGNKNQLEVRDDDAVVKLTSIDNKLTSVSNRLQTQSTIVDAGGDVATISRPSQISGTSLIRGLDAQSYVNAYDTYNNAYDNLTMTSSLNPSGSVFYKALDVYARNPNTQVINYGQTSGNGKTGINMYQIYPKKIHYTLSGRSESGAASVIMGGTGSQKFIYDFTFGKNNPQTFSAILSATSGTPRTLKYHYVDSLGDLKTDGSITISTTAVTNLTPSNIISINKYWINGDVGISEQALIRVGNLNNNAIFTIASTDYNDYYNGVITCPNGYIMYLTQFSIFTPSPMYMYVIKWDENSIRSVVYTHFNSANAPVCSGSNGSIGGIFTAGESIAFAKGFGGASIITGNVVLEPI